MSNSDLAPKKDVRDRGPLFAWFDVRGRHIGSWAFALNRLTGIGLTVYLFLHLGVLSTLLQGPEAYDGFIAIARTPLFLSFDVVLLFGLLFHGLNGIRVGLVGMGVAVRQERALFWTLMAAGAVALVVSALLIFSK